MLSTLGDIDPQQFWGRTTEKPSVSGAEARHYESHDDKEMETLDSSLLQMPTRVLNMSLTTGSLGAIPGMHTHQNV